MGKKKGRFLDLTTKMYLWLRWYYMQRDGVLWHDIRSCRAYMEESRFRWLIRAMYMYVRKGVIIHDSNKVIESTLNDLRRRTEQMLSRLGGAVINKQKNKHKKKGE